MERTIQTYSSQGKNHVNQDMYGITEHVCFVFDGATSLFGDDLLGGNDVQRCMQMLRDNLLVHAEEKKELKEILRTALVETRVKLFEHVNNLQDIPEYALPTFALAMARFDQEEVEVLILADCEVWADGERIKDSGFFAASRRNEENTRKILKKYKADSRSELSREAVQEIYVLDQNVRRSLNTPQGYWVGSLDGKGLDHAVHRRIKRPKTLALYCDGFAHLLDLDDGLLYKDMEAVEQLRHCTEDDVTLVRIEEKA